MPRVPVSIGRYILVCIKDILIPRCLIYKFRFKSQVWDSGLSIRKIKREFRSKMLSTVINPSYERKKRRKKSFLSSVSPFLCFFKLFLSFHRKCLLSGHLQWPLLKKCFFIFSSSVFTLRNVTERKTFLSLSLFFLFFFGCNMQFVGF